MASSLGSLVVVALGGMFAVGYFLPPAGGRRRLMVLDTFPSEAAARDALSRGAV